MRSIKKGATSQSVYFEFLDSTSTTGGRKTGMAFNSSGLTAYYARNGAAATAITLATLASASAAWSSGGFVEVDATNMPGIYRLDVPNAAVASGADSVVITLKGVTGMAQASLEVALVAYDPQDAVRLGLTALPNATAGANGGLPLGDASGRVTVAAIANGAIAAATFAANALDAVWSTATRVLTAGTNIVLAKGTGVTGFNDVTAAAVRTEMDTNSTKLANLDATVSSRLAAASYSAPLDASGTRAAVGLASASLDTQLGAIAGYVDTEIGALQTTATAIKAKTDNLPAAPAAVSDIPTANANADALLDRAAGVETGWTLRQSLRIMLSVLAGKASGLETTTAVYRDMADSKNRISATVDANGNRSAVTRDAT